MKKKPGKPMDILKIPGRLARTAPRISLLETAKLTGCGSLAVKRWAYRLYPEAFNAVEDGKPLFLTWDEAREVLLIPVKRERGGKIDKKVLRQAAADRPDAFLKEYAEPFGCTAAAVFRALEKLDITRKKSRSPIAKNKKNAVRNTARIKRVPRNKRVYADESGVNTCLPREYARTPRGERAGDLKRGSRFERVNVIGALCAGAHWAVECYRRAVSGEFFERRFTGCLPAAIPKGYTVIMDSAPFRRKKRLRKLAGGKVRLLFLPPYSPDYNPIEKSWANMKRFLRNNPRDFQSVNSAVYDYFGVP